MSKSYHYEDKIKQHCNGFQLCNNDNDILSLKKIKISDLI